MRAKRWVVRTAIVLTAGLGGCKEPTSPPPERPREEASRLMGAADAVSADVSATRTPGTP
jgi:hypothetical protein